uniref:SUEL-type lectin domain-containing protein n=1 Tax=Nothoprocta perdicaria TaxID=30464 RepID=A0A8C6ZFZ9_NOTPE
MQFCRTIYEYKSKAACEDDKLRLSCKKSMVIAIYSAVFGRTQGDLGNSSSKAECQSATALQIMIKRCHGKRSCSIYASTYEFGDPCYPGIRKHLNVIYTCAAYEKRQGCNCVKKKIVELSEDYAGYCDSYLPSFFFKIP